MRIKVFGCKIIEISKQVRTEWQKKIREYFAQDLLKLRREVSIL